MIKDTIKRTITCDAIQCEAKVEYAIEIFEAEDSGYLRMGYDGEEASKDWDFKYGVTHCPACKLTGSKR